MKKYVIVTKNQVSELEQEVTDRLNDGWITVGGISMVYKHEHTEHVHGHLVYAQAMEKTNA